MLFPFTDESESEYAELRLPTGRGKAGLPVLELNGVDVPVSSWTLSPTSFDHSKAEATITLPVRLAPARPEPEPETCCEAQAPAASTPRLGQQVHYRAHGSADGTYPQTCRTALVTEAFDNGDARLSVFHEGLFFKVCSYADHEAAQGGTWHFDCTPADEPDTDAAEDSCSAPEECLSFGSMGLGSLPLLRLATDYQRAHWEAMTRAEERLLFGTEHPDAGTATLRFDTTAVEPEDTSAARAAQPEPDAEENRQAARRLVTLPGPFEGVLTFDCVSDNAIRTLFAFDPVHTDHGQADAEPEQPDDEEDQQEPAARDLSGYRLRPGVLSEETLRALFSPQELRSLVLEPADATPVNVEVRAQAPLTIGQIEDQLLRRSIQRGTPRAFDYPCGSNLSATQKQRHFER